MKRHSFPLFFFLLLLCSCSVTREQCDQYSQLATIAGRILCNALAVTEKDTSAQVQQARQFIQVETSAAIYQDAAYVRDALLNLQDVSTDSTAIRQLQSLTAQLSIELYKRSYMMKPRK